MKKIKKKIIKNIFVQNILGIITDTYWYHVLYILGIVVTHIDLFYPSENSF